MREDLNILDAFPATPHEEWLAAVDKQLKGKPFDKVLVKKTYEGIPILPMYFKHDLEGLPHVDTYPGFAPYVRGNRASGNRAAAWQTAQEIIEPDPDTLNESLKKDLARGQDTLNIKLDRAGCEGLNPDTAPKEDVGKDGVSLATARDWARILTGMDMAKTPLMADAGMNAPAAAALLAAGLEPAVAKTLSGSLGLDPLGVLSREGTLATDLPAAYDAMAGLTLWAADRMPGMKTIRVSAEPMAHAGAHGVQEVGFAVATAVTYIRQMQARGLNIDQICPAIQFCFGIGPDFFMEIAKFRAARMVWHQTAKAFGAKDFRMIIHARTGLFNKTVIDPWVNMLRVCTETFSGVAGGCDSIHTGAFDETVRTPDEFSRRIARNVHTLFKEEAHFDKVADPAGGSWYVENITLELAQKAWQLFQEVEASGGMEQALKDGFVQGRISETAGARVAATATRKDRIVGVNIYPNLTETPLSQRAPLGDDFYSACKERLSQDRANQNRDVLAAALETVKAARGKEKMQAAVIAAQAGATLEDLSAALGPEDRGVQVPKLSSLRRSRPFETLRKTVEAFKEKAGRPLEIFMANVGPLSRHKPRSDFSTAFFNVAAIETRFTPGFENPDDAVKAALDSGLKAVVICGTDDDYLAAVPGMVKQIKAADPGILTLVAGYAKTYVDDFKAAGVDEFIHIKADALGILTKISAHLMPGGDA